MSEALIREEIKAKGALSQSRFMELALKSYYETHRGVGQDFTTAPEISQMFGELIGIWVLDLYQKLGSPPKIMCVELGPGRGTLMADVLRVAKLSSAFWEAVEIHFIEFSPQLRKYQRQALPRVPVVGMKILKPYLQRHLLLSLQMNFLMLFLQLTILGRREFFMKGM